MYKLTAQASGVIRLKDNAFIPEDWSNSDYREYRTWLEEGGIPAHPDVPVITPLTIIAELEAEQIRRLTPRATREFMLAVASLIPAGIPTPPGVAALQELDTAIRVERAKL